MEIIFTPQQKRSPLAASGDLFLVNSGGFYSFTNRVVVVRPPATTRSR
jgi:hypothetical protein